MSRCCGVCLTSSQCAAKCGATANMREFLPPAQESVRYYVPSQRLEIVIRLIDLPKVQITEADEAEVSTATDYGAIVYPPHVSLQRVPAIVKNSNTYRVVSESQDAWRVEVNYNHGGDWCHCHTFANPQSAYAWLEETGRV